MPVSNLGNKKGKLIWILRLVLIQMCKERMKHTNFTLFVCNDCYDCHVIQKPFAFYFSFQKGKNGDLITPHEYMTACEASNLSRNFVYLPSIPREDAIEPAKTWAGSRSCFAVLFEWDISVSSSVKPFSGPLHFCFCTLHKVFNAKFPHVFEMQFMVVNMSCDPKTTVSFSDGSDIEIFLCWALHFSVDVS